MHGNLEVITKYVTKDGIPLVRWLSDISNQLTGENTRWTSMEEEQLERHRKIGFQAEKKTVRQWNEKYILAKNYYEQYGNLNVPISYSVNGVKLGR